MPSLAQRPADRLAIANALLPVLASRMRVSRPELDTSAAAAIERAEWPGNVQQMRSVLAAAMAAHRDEGHITGREIETQLDHLRPTSSNSNAEENAGFDPWLDRMLSTGDFSMAELERQIYSLAVARTAGNLSAAARVLGITRAQLAYRVGKHGANDDGDR
jgi:DNA-binding NtrC family response regulator